MKTSSKTLRDVEREKENDGIWPMSSYVLFNEHCSERLMCNGCYADNLTFDEHPCNVCKTARPSKYSTTPPPKRVRKVLP